MCELAQLLEESANSLREHLPLVRQLDWVETMRRVDHLSNDPCSEVSRLKRHLSDAEPYTSLWGQWLTTPSSMSSRASAERAFDTMLYQVLNGHAAFEIENELNKLATSRTASFFLIAEIAGVSCTETIDLGDGYFLQPMAVSEVQQSPSELTGLMQLPPTAKIEKTYNNFACVSQSAPHLLAPLQDLLTPLQDTRRSIDDAVRCLNIIGAPGARSARTTWASNNALLNQMIGSADFWPYRLDTLTLPSNTQSFNAKELQTAIRQIRELRTKDSRRAEMICRGIDLIARASQRLSQIDRAIDLGTALEVMLDYGETEKQGTAKRVSQKGARLFGDTDATRARIETAIKNTYSDRSQAIHKGELDGSDCDIATRFEDGVALACRIARKLIDTGSS